MLFERVEMKLFSELNKQFLIGLSQVFRRDSDFTTTNVCPSVINL